MNESGASTDFRIQRADGINLGAIIDGVTHSGEIDFGAGNFINLFEFIVRPQDVGIPIHLSVNNLDPNADIRLDALSATIDFHSKSSAMASVDASGPGGDEHLPAVTFAQAGRYALVISKANPAPPLASSSLFEIVISTIGSVLDAPETAGPAPTKFALSAPRPNPFAGQATIELAVPADGGKASVAVYDLQGRRIAAAGVYFVRLEAPGVRETKKITLLR